MTNPQKKQNSSTLNDVIVSHMFLVKQEVRKLIRSGVSKNEFDELVQIARGVEDAEAVVQIFNQSRFDTGRSQLSGVCDSRIASMEI